MLWGCHDADGIKPTATADFLGGEGIDFGGVAFADGVVGDVVEVGAALMVAVDGLGIEIGVGVEGGALLVGKEYPVAALGCGSHGAEGDGEGENDAFHNRYVFCMCLILRKYVVKYFVALEVVEAREVDLVVGDECAQ